MGGTDCACGQGRSAGIRERENGSVSAGQTNARDRRCLAAGVGQGEILRRARGTGGFGFREDVIEDL